MDIKGGGMGKRLWLALSGLAAAFFIIVLGSSAGAWTQFKSGNAATVPAGQTVDSTLFAGAKNIDIAGTVNGDLFCGAQTVNISGTVKGDVICGAQTININGTVEGSVRLGAQTVNLNGSIGRNATIAAQTITTDSKSSVANDASFAGSELNLNGTIGRDLAAGGQTVNLSGTVGRDIKSGGQQLNLLAGTKVGGSIDYTSKNKISTASGANVSGTITQHFPKHKNRSWVKVAVFTGVATLLCALVLLINALVVTAIFPRMVHAVSNQGMKRPWWVLLTGFAASFLAPILIFLLMVTVVLVPLAVILLFCWLVIAFSSGLFTAYYIGRRLLTSQNPLLRVLLGSFILLVLFLIPYLGFLVMLASFWIGSGMVLLALKDKYPKPTYSLK